ncbi:MAG: hypothetical protein H7844_05625 [Nitrospirae bacterium YQR-1]
MWIITEPGDLLNLDNIIRIKRVHGDGVCKIVAETVRGEEVFIRPAHRADEFNECIECGNSGKETGMIKLMRTLEAVDMRMKNSSELHFRTGKK